MTKEYTTSLKSHIAPHGNHLAGCVAHCLIMNIAKIQVYIDIINWLYVKISEPERIAIGTNN